MRLFTHLAISHSAPVVVVTLALALTLTALIRISMVLTTLSESELDVLRDEGELHRAAWTLDVAMRHGQLACAADGRSDEVADRIRRPAAELRGLVSEVAPGDMRRLAEGYLATASRVLAVDACDALLGADLQRERAVLDEQLTNVWVARLGELHAAVADKDAEARSIAVSATWIGLPLAAASFLLAMLIARRMARIVNRPLAPLADLARRVGRGDFGMSIQVDGPAEVLALAEELEGMRTQLQQLEQLKQGFLASVSHELRTPLSKIREALALLEDGAVGRFEPKQMRVIRIARTACEHEIRMVTTLLDLSRLRAGSHVRMRDGVAIDRVLQGAVSDELLEATSRGVSVELRTDGHRPVGRLDPVLIERAVANLIRNAIAVSKSGQRVIVQRILEIGDQGRARLRVTVSDEGPGVPDDIRDRLFEPFVTRPVPKAGKSLGVGLGLALAREVAQAHDGDLTLVDSSDRGTTLELHLPVELEEDAAPEVQRDDAPRASASVSPVTP